MIFFRMSYWRRLARDEGGDARIRYGLVASLMAIALAGTLG
jgi:Flp pilus assembly pilin Flp